MGLRALSVAITGILLSACVAPREGAHGAGPLDVAAAAAMTANEAAASKKDQTTFAWGIEVVGDRTKFRLCTAEDACGVRLVDVPSKAVLSVKVVGRTRPSADDGSRLDEVDVVRVELDDETRISRGGAASDARGLVIGGPTK
jgi:hypothetical protein